MGRPRNKEQSIRIRFEGYQRMPVDDPRTKVAVDWYLSNRENRQAFPIMWQLIIAALNGELGEGVQVAVQQGSTDDAIDALQDLMGAFAG